MPAKRRARQVTRTVGRPAKELGPYRNNIRRERYKAGFITQLEFAAKTGIEPSWYTRIESGRALASPNELDAIVRTLRTQPQRIYDKPFLAAIDAARETREPVAT